MTLLIAIITGMINFMIGGLYAMDCSLETHGWSHGHKTKDIGKNGDGKKWLWQQSSKSSLES